MDASVLKTRLSAHSEASLLNWVVGPRDQLVSKQVGTDTDRYADVDGATAQTRIIASTDRLDR
jgi:hypothetical protein